VQKTVKLETKRRIVAAVGIVGFCCISLVVAYLMGFMAPFKQRCSEECHAQGKASRVVPSYPATMVGNKGNGFFGEKCECF
jgi:hypothetical protein